MKTPGMFLQRTGLFTALLLLAVSLGAQTPKTLKMTVIKEPKEGAFTILKPAGWKAEGGIVRWDPVTYGGPANAIEAKVDFKLKKDAAGTVQIHWVPEIYYVDVRGTMAAMTFAEGQWYNGMPVLRKMDARTFLTTYLAGYHEYANSIKTTESKSLPEIEKLCYELDFMKQMRCAYTAAIADFSFTMKGVRYKERAFCIIQDMGPYTNGMWRNRHTVSVRAPAAEFDRWEPLFKEIIASVKLDPSWIKRELRSQMNNGSTMIKTQAEVNRIGQEIAKGHAETNAKINHQAYLNLTDQEDYVNPYNNRVETGTNQYDHRWVDDLGNVIYSNDDNYNPNYDQELQMTGFKQSRVKK